MLRGATTGVSVVWAPYRGSTEKQNSRALLSFSYNATNVPMVWFLTTLDVSCLLHLLLCFDFPKVLT